MDTLDKNGKKKQQAAKINYFSHDANLIIPGLLARFSLFWPEQKDLKVKILHCVRERDGSSISYKTSFHESRMDIV